MRVKYTISIINLMKSVEKRGEIHFSKKEVESDFFPYEGRVFIFLKGFSIKVSEVIILANKESVDEDEKKRPLVSARFILDSTTLFSHNVYLEIVRQLLEDGWTIQEK